jgi:hypothetical protein
MVATAPEQPMADTSSISSLRSAPIARQPVSLSQVPGASSSLFGNLLRKSEVAMGLRSQTGFSSGATYEAQTIAGQTKATVNNAVSATKSFFHIK